MAVKGWAGGEDQAWDDSDTPDVIPPTAAGLYEVECVKAEVGSSKDGKPQITVTAKLINRFEKGDTALASPTPARGQQREWITFDKDAEKDAISRVKEKQAREAFGAEKPANLSSDALEECAKSYVGQRAYALFGEPQPGMNDPSTLFGKLRRFCTAEKAAELNAEAEAPAGGKRKRKSTAE